MKFAEWAKAWVALVGLVAAGVAGVPDIPLSWKLPLSIVIAVAGAFAVWKVENKDPEPPAPNWTGAGPAWEEPYDGTLLSPEEPEDPRYPLRLVPGHKSVPPGDVTWTLAA